MKLVPGALGQSIATTRTAFNIARPRQPLFFLSHTRSYSSLLCHILNSNPAIDGYGELWLDYRNHLDLITMRYKVAMTLDGRLRGRYTLDKLLHNRLTIDPIVLTDPSACVMIGIREPIGAVNSILATGRRPNAPRWKRTPEAACDHYIKRVATIVGATELRSDVAAFPTDALINDSEGFLRELSDWLDLDEPLSPAYEVGRLTGQPKFGDTSESIRAGAIVKERSSEHAELSDELTEAIWSTYESAFETLDRRAGRVIGSTQRMLRDTSA